jgi:hypothetical protein
MYSSVDDSIVTLAGSGEAGFNEDGPGRTRMLRQPESVALRPGSQPLEVWFSDFGNQRVRYVTESSTGWVVNTMVGTGTKGDDPACDTGCHRLSAPLHNPRALAFSSDGDLYIADSGNRKIRRLSLQDDILTTFIGTTVPSFNASQNYYGHGRWFLPGNWEEANLNVRLASLYFLTIDKEDRLWFADSGGDNANRLLVAPLHNDSYQEVWVSNDMGAYQHFHLLHFGNALAGSSKAARAALEEELATGLAAWGPAIYPSLPYGSVVNQSTGMQTGLTYWKYAQPETGEWCDELTPGNREVCREVNAQFWRFQTTMGFCFDQFNTMIFNDFTSSQVLEIADDNVRTRGFSPRVLGGTCPCLRFWWLPSNDHPFCLDYPNLCSTPQARHLCNPGDDVAAQLVVNETLLTFPHFNLQLADLPLCVTTNYCANTGYDEEEAPWCMLNASSPSCNYPKSWSLCERAGVSVMWRPVPNAAILGSELRVTQLLNVDPVQLANYELLLTDDLWLNAGAQAPSGHFASDILYGFEIPTTCSGPCSEIERPLWNPSNLNCNGDPCCGMPQVESTSSSSIVCRLQNKADYSLLTVNTTLVWKKVTINLNTASAKITIEDCRRKCEYEERCRAFMVKYDVTSDTYKDASLCVFFEHTYPYYVYELDRSQTWDDLQQARKLFSAAKSPFSRTFDSTAGLHVSDDGLNAKDMVAGPYVNASLSLEDCMDLCILNSLCFSLAYPGCYLLNRQNVLPQADGHLLDSRSIVYVRENAGAKVKGIVGYPSVYSFGGEESSARFYNAMVNRPTECVVDSQGDVILADVWNQRIRKITRKVESCRQNTIGITESEVNQTWVEQSKLVDAECQSSVTMSDLYSQMKNEVLTSKITTTMEEHFCKYQPTSVADPNWLNNFTHNTLALCLACFELAPRPDICPPVSMCRCHDAMTVALESPVYLHCPARSAAFDPWHIWYTSYVTCWFKPAASDALYLTDSSMRANLKAKVEDYCILHCS